jgi:hypothetical protein
MALQEESRTSRPSASAAREIPDADLPHVQEGDHPMMRWVTEPTMEVAVRTDFPDGPINLAGIVVVTAPD